MTFSFSWENLKGFLLWLRGLFMAEKKIPCPYCKKNEGVSILYAKEQMDEKCREFFEKEVARFEDISIKANYLYHPKIYSLNIFIVVVELGSIVFVSYKFNKENLDDVRREQLIASTHSSDVLRPLL
jgi:hypothetical protein